MRDFLVKLFDLVWQTIQAPRRTAERILALDLPMHTAWEALALSVLATVILMVGLVLGTPRIPSDPGQSTMATLYSGPFAVAIGQSINSVLVVFAVLWIGRLFGGQGRLKGAVTLVAWHQIFLLCLALASVLIGALIPPIQTLLFFVLLGFFFYVLAQFICALHGFKSGLLVLAGVIGIYFAILLALLYFSGILAYFSETQTRG